MTDESQTPQEPEECYRCGTQLPAGAKRCPKCGRRQYRACYCGNQIPVTAPTCPYCGADWSGSRRVTRRKSRSSRIRPRALVKSAAIGAGIALAATAIVFIIIGYFARLGAAGGAVPPEFAIQVQMASTAVRDMAAGVGAAIVRRSQSVTGFVIGLAIGAAVGGALYLTRVGILKLGRKRRKGSRGSRRSRRSKTR